MFDQHHAEDVGRILLQAQNALKSVREQIADGSATPVDLDRVLERTEADLRSKAELVLSAVTQNTATALPTADTAASSWWRLRQWDGVATLNCGAHPHPHRV